MNKLTNLLPLRTLPGPMSVLFVFSIPLAIKFHNIAVILFLVLCIVTIKWKETLRLKWQGQPVPALYVLQVIIIALGLLHSANLDAGFNDMERAIYAVAILPIIYLMRSTGDSVFRLLTFFSVSCIGLALFGFVASWIALGTTSFTEVVRIGHLTIDSYLSIQPLYLSMYLILVLFFLLESIRTKYDTLSTGGKWGLVCSSLLVIAIVIFLRSKTALLLLPALLLIYLVIVLKKRGWLVVFVLMTVGLLTLLLDKDNPNVVDKYGVVSKAFDQRVNIWKGAIEGIRQSPLIGAGTGGAQELLNVGYERIGYEEGIANEFNAHNQYLQFMARNGLPELLCFLAILSYSFWKSTKQSNYTFLMFNMLVSLVMLTESFLSVQKGIAFFYFFLLAFVYLPEKKQEQIQI